MAHPDQNGGTSHDVPHNAHAALPPEIAFLARYNVSIDVLASIAAMPPPANAACPGYDEIAIRNGFVTEEHYYRALAAELQLPFIDSPGDLRLSADLQSLQALLVQIKGSKLRALAAPVRHRLSYLVGCNRAHLAGLAITTPSRLKAALRRNLRTRTSTHAAHSTSICHPGHSVFHGLANWQIGMLLLITPFLSYSLTADPIKALSHIGIILLPVFILNIIIKITALYNSKISYKKYHEFDEHEFPKYTVIVPLYREIRIIDQLLAGLSSLNYPKAALDIKILVEENDPETLKKLRASELPPYFEIIVAPAGSPQTKPRALNIGLQEATGVYVTVFDAEDIPDKNQLRLAANMFASLPTTVGSLQAELRIDNGVDSYPAMFLALEYAGLFTVLNPGLVESKLPFLLGGTSNHFRVDVLRNIGGWDAWNLTEDADIGCRLVANGYSLMVMNSYTQEEAPVAWGAWVRQRVRWMKGFVQTAMTLSQTPSLMCEKIGMKNFIVLLTLSIGTVLSALFFPIALIGVPTMLWLYREIFSVVSPLSVAMGFMLTFYVVGIASMIIPTWIGAKRAGLQKWRFMSLFMPFYAVAISISAWISLVEIARRPFYWDKTEHGLSKARHGPKPLP
jgi:glycosyltransferase XagB